MIGRNGRRATAWSVVVATLLAFASVAHAADDNIGVVLLSEVRLLDADDPSIVLDNFRYSTSDWLLSVNERPTVATLDWVNKWKTSYVSFCWTRYDQNTWDNDGMNSLSGGYPVATSGPLSFSSGTVTLQARYRGDPIMLQNGGVVSWGSNETGQKCIRLMGTDANGDIDGSAVCMSDSFDVYGDGDALSWSIKEDALPSSLSVGGPVAVAAGNHQVLLDFTSLDFNLHPIDWSDSATFVDADTLFERGEAGLQLNNRGVPENKAVYILRFERACPASGTLDGSEPENFITGVTNFDYHLKWDPTYSFGPTAITCASAGGDFDCNCDDGNCALRMERMPLELPAGHDWTNTSSLTPGIYQNYHALNGWTVSWKPYECGAAHARMYRLSMFTEDHLVTWTRHGRLVMTQSSPANNNCQSTIGSNNDRQEMRVDEDDHDAKRPAQAAQITDDFTKRSTSASFDLETRQLSFRIGSRMFTAEQYATMGFQTFATIVGVGTGYPPDFNGGTGYDFTALADGTTKRVCVNWPEDYWTTGSFAQSNTINFIPVGQNRVDAFHDFLFNSYTFPSRDSLFQLWNTGYGMAQQFPTSNPSNYLTNTQFRLMPVRLVEGNVVKDVKIEKETIGDQEAFYAEWNFEGTIDEFVNCVPPNKDASDDADSRPSAVININNGVLNEDANGAIAYSIPVFVRRTTYEGSRIRGPGKESEPLLWAVSNDDVTQRFVYQITLDPTTGTMVSVQADSVEIKSELRWAKYSASTVGACLTDATTVGLNAGFSCQHNENDMPRQLHIRASVAITPTNANAVGLIADPNAYQKSANIDLSYVGDNYEIVSVSYGTDPNNADADEIDAQGRRLFYIEFKTATVSVYNHNQAQIRTDTFLSGADNPRAFHLVASLYRVKNGVGDGNWDNSYTKGTPAGPPGVMEWNDVELDSHFSLNIDLTFDVAPVVTMADHQLSIGYEVESAIFQDVRAGQGCTSGGPCAPMTEAERHALPREGYMTIMVRPTVGLPETVTGHIREVRMCTIQERSPWSGCVGTSNDENMIHDCTGRGMHDNSTASEFVDAFTKASQNTFDGGALGNHALEDTCNAALWGAFIMANQQNPTPTWQQAANLAEYDPDNEGPVPGPHPAVLLNPILLEKVYAHNFVSQPVTNNDAQQVAGSSTLCRGDEGGKEESIVDSHGAWACEKNTHCPWWTTWKAADDTLQYGLTDGLVAATDVWPLNNAEIRMEVVYDLHECTAGAFSRRLRSTGTPNRLLSNPVQREYLESHLKPGMSMGQLHASTDPVYTAKMRKLAEMGVTAISIGVTGSLTTFSFEDITVDDGEDDSQAAEDAKQAKETSALTLILILVGGCVLLALAFAYWCKNRVFTTAYGRVPTTDSEQGPIPAAPTRSGKIPPPQFVPSASSR